MTSVLDPVGMTPAKSVLGGGYDDLVKSAGTPTGIYNPGANPFGSIGFNQDSNKELNFNGNDYSVVTHGEDGRVDPYSGNPAAFSQAATINGVQGWRTGMPWKDFIESAKGAGAKSASQYTADGSYGQQEHPEYGHWVPNSIAAPIIGELNQMQTAKNAKDTGLRDGLMLLGGVAGLSGLAGAFGGELGGVAAEGVSVPGAYSGSAAGTTATYDLASGIPELVEGGAGATGGAAGGAVGGTEAGAVAPYLGDAAYETSGVTDLASRGAETALNGIESNPWYQDLVKTLAPNQQSAARSVLSQFIQSGGKLGDTSTGSLIPGVPNNVLGQLLSAGAGYVGSTNLANSLKQISDQARADRAPALGAFNSALNNPDTWYKSAPGMGAADSILRKLSVNGNPSMNAGDLSKAAAYNLGAYTDWLKTLQGPAFSGAATNAALATTAATAAQNPLNALGYGANAALNPQPNILDFLSAVKGTNGGLPVSATPSNETALGVRPGSVAYDGDPSYDKGAALDYADL